MRNVGGFGGGMVSLEIQTEGFMELEMERIVPESARQPTTGGSALLVSRNYVQCTQHGYC